MRISDWSSDVCSSDLTVFMVLPTSTQPADAVRDLVATTRALAEKLNAEVFDANRQVFTAEAQRVLMAEVDAWAKRNGLSYRAPECLHGMSVHQSSSERAEALPGTLHEPPNTH